ncbi:hypothetical protein [Streptacidiphilus sp. PB12-B1b]|uniref:hypothetical protein n=1 Tax=Streptacidiphilus sp. PB12-B1b TaxID=2705012 RepID=UPI001CDC8D70|nr:hypothetical protein [Streptacidiphilus sp. PB12-B1b]
MSGDEHQTLGALLVRLEAQEKQIAAQAEAAHEQITQLTALLDGLAQAADHIAITRKTLLNLPDEVPPATTPTVVVPEGPAYQQILAVFADTDAPLRARNVCEAMDLPLTPNNINNIRTKLKRLTRHGILTEIAPGQFTTAQPLPTGEPTAAPLTPDKRMNQT